MDYQFIQEKKQQIDQEISKVIIGMEDIVEYLTIAIFTNGHVIMEGVPGIAKTLLAKCMAKCLDIKYNRIQFTPDLMPTDIIGTNVFNVKNSEFTFHEGPIFSNIVLIDEINRAPAKTQAALFEVMEERQITVDGQSYNMEFPFLVLATQNPIDQEGTYKLPEAQLDRFIFKLELNYPDLHHEIQILSRFQSKYLSTDLTEIKACITAQDLFQIQQSIQEVYAKDELINYISNITYKTRNHPHLFLGGSPRASLAILKSAKCKAAISGRDFITPEDVQFVSYPVLNHRILLTSEKELEGVKSADVIKDIIHSIDVPR
jgi:MoxR-like ATPase